MKPIRLLFVCQMTFLSLTSLAQSETDSPIIDPETNCKIRYYYYPNLEAYFDNEKKAFLYKVDGKWSWAETIPSGYRGYSLFNRAHFPINDYDDDNPVQFLEQHRKKFPYQSLKRMKMTASVR